MKYDFCKFKNDSSSGKPAELFFYGDIVSDSWSRWQAEDQYPQNVKELLADIGDSDIDIHINSGGGDVFAGFAICNMLRSLKGHKTVYIDGNAASIASVIAMAGDEIVMPENAFMMIHKASSFGVGNADDMRELADVLDKIDEGIIATYLTKTVEGVTDKKIKKMMAAETWLNASEAAELFKNIKTTEKTAAVASLDSKFKGYYANIPDCIKNAAEESPIGKPQAANVPEGMEKYARFGDLMKIKFN